MKENRILFLGEYTGFAGGIERYAFQSALILRKNGIGVDWCGRFPAREEKLFRTGFDKVLSPEELLSAGTEYALAALHKLPERPFLAALRARFGEKLVFWAHDHDLYCPRRHYYTPFGRTNCHRAYSPFRCFFCSAVTSPRNWRHRRKDTSFFLRELGNHRAIVLSSFMKENLVRNGFHPSLVRRIPPVIPVPEVVSSPAEEEENGPLKILFLGQLIRGKGADLLLDALKLLSVPWHAVIAGDGPDRIMLEERARKENWTSLVEFPRWLADPSSALAGCDVAVFPSRWQEPFGLSGAEASAYGKPVVAFDVGGVREWLEDAVTGFAVPERDTVLLAEKLELLFSDRALRRRMGEAGRRKMREEFSEEKFLSSFRSLLEEVSS